MEKAKMHLNCVSITLYRRLFLQTKMVQTILLYFAKLNVPQRTVQNAV